MVGKTISHSRVWPSARTSVRTGWHGALQTVICGTRGTDGHWRGALQTLSVEEAQARRARLAKLRSLLFHQEAKLTHAARIKSKAYHRRLKRAARPKVLPPGGFFTSLFTVGPSRSPPAMSTESFL